MIRRFLDKIDSLSVKKLSIILFIIGFLVYIPSLFNGFVWDDIPQVVQNPILQNISYFFTLFSGSTFYGGNGTGLIGNYYKPLMPLSFMLLNVFFGLQPFYFHLFDVLLHCLNGVLLFLFLKKIFDYLSMPLPRVVSFLLAFLFLIHPVNVESVVYISSTQELLYTCFMLTSFLIVFSLKEKLSSKKIILLSLSLLASILSKESGALAFVLVFVLLFALRIQKKKYILFAVFFTGIAYMFLRFFIAHVWFISASPLIPIQTSPLIVRLQTIPYEIFSYLRLLLFPKNLFIYQDELIASVSDPRFYQLIPIAGSCIVFLIFLFFTVKNTFFRFFLLWIVLGFGLLMNILPLDMTIAERWLYGPLIGLLGGFGILLYLFSKKYPWIFQGFLLFCIALAPFYIWRDVTRELAWQSNTKLFTTDVQYEKASARLYNDLGIFMVGSNQNESEKYFKKSIAINPNQFQAYDNLGILYNKEGDFSKAKLSFLLSMGHGALVSTYLNYASFLILHKQYQEALSFLRYRALILFPQNPELYSLLSTVYTALGNKTQAQQAQQRADMLNMQKVTVPSQSIQLH